MMFASVLTKFLILALSWLSVQGNGQNPPIIPININVKCYPQFGCAKGQSSGSKTIQECCNTASGASARIVNPLSGALAKACISCSTVTCFSNDDCTGHWFGYAHDLDKCCELGYNSVTLRFYTGYCPHGQGQETNCQSGDVCVQCPGGGGGGDPHFAVLLADGQSMCFSLQGEQGFIFNLVHSYTLTINALFVKDPVRDEVTWLGSLAVIINNLPNQNFNQSVLLFDISDRSVSINGENKLKAGDIEAIRIEKNKLNIVSKYSQSPHSSVLVVMKDIGLVFSVEYMDSHLDLLFRNVPSTKEADTCHSHGLLGQFFCPGHTVDITRKLLMFPSHKEPIPVVRRPIWSFMERRKTGQHSHFCWMTMNNGYQGEGIIDGTYLDYVVSSLTTIPDLKHFNQ